MNPLVLIILDGWGLSPEIDGNAILSVETPNYDQLLGLYPSGSLHASGEEVGLSWGEIGNSEVGHLNIGTGRIVTQDLPRIDNSIRDKTFFSNDVILEALNYCLAGNSNLHLIGLVSSGGVHSHINHLFALLELAKSKKVSNVYIHFIADGRDSPPKVALNDLNLLENKCQEIGLGKVATVMGRYYAMDRDKRWDRTQKAYDSITDHSFVKVKSAQEAINNTYNSGKSDEFIDPVAIENTPRIADKDAVIFFNYRPDRAKQLTDAITNPNFNSFSRKIALKEYKFVSFTNYGNEPSSQVKIAFFAEQNISPLAEVLSKNNLTQLHIAETEKYPHVTYFFNGGKEQAYTGEKRLLIPSPKVATYDLKPQMSAQEVAQQFVNAFSQEKPMFTIINFANPDMVGHTGNFEAVKSAIKTTDQCLGLVANQVINSGGNLIVTADHGNAEQMKNLQTGEIDKEHTTNPVPFILVLKEYRQQSPIGVDENFKISMAVQSPLGVLADITATCLDILNIEKPQIMIGQSLKTIF